MPIDFDSLLDVVIVQQDTCRIAGFAVDHLLVSIQRTLLEPIRNRIQVSPLRLQRFHDDVVTLRDKLLHSQLVQLSPAEAGLLKRALLEKSKHLATERDHRLMATTDPLTRDEIHLVANELTPLMKRSWFEAVTAPQVPRLTDFLNLRSAYDAIELIAQAQRKDAPTREPQFDEKFGILQASSRFLPDLAFYRQECGLRGNSLSAAFVDVDDFKAMNTLYSETKVDRDILPPLMFAVEAHVNARGHAYKQGGDEYIVLLPNAGRAEAVAILSSLQAKVLALSFGPLITEKITTSIGLCTIGDDCHLTDREVLEAMNRAEAHAKKNDKNCIVTYEGTRYGAEDLVVAGRGGIVPA